MTSAFGALGGASSASQVPSLLGTTDSRFLKPPPAQTQPDAAPTKTFFASMGTSAQSSAPQVVADATKPTGMFGTQTTQAQSKPLFFQNVINTTTQPSLFPPVAATTQTQKPSLFGTENTAQPQPGASARSLFAHLEGAPPIAGPQLQLPAFQQAQQAPTAQPVSTNSQPAYFDALLEKGRNRTNTGKMEGAGLQEIPSLQLGLPDISRQVRQLGGLRANTQQGNRTDTKA